MAQFEDATIVKLVLILIVLEVSLWDLMVVVVFSVAIQVLILIVLEVSLWE